MKNKAHNFRDLSKMRFGILTAIRPTAPDKHGSMVWEMKCDCGKTCKTISARLIGGTKMSCGCIKVPKKRTGRDPYVCLLGSYKSRAKTKGLEFSLTKEYFISIVSQNCSYCNAPPTPRTYKRGRKYDNLLTVNVSGIDRIDSNIGYKIGNVRPCCTRCNRMKSDMSVDEFLSSVKTIYETLFHPSLRE